LFKKEGKKERAEWLKAPVLSNFALGKKIKKLHTVATSTFF
jgi:hypothetical protein